MTDQDRRQGYDNFLSVLKEATADMSSLVTDKLNDYATESRASLAKINTTVELTAQTTHDLSKIVKPIPVQIAKIETDLARVVVNDAEQFNMFRDLEVRLAKPIATTAASFWVSSIPPHNFGVLK